MKTIFCYLALLLLAIACSPEFARQQLFVSVKYFIGFFYISPGHGAFRDFKTAFQQSNIHGIYSTVRSYATGRYHWLVDKIFFRVEKMEFSCSIQYNNNQYLTATL